MGLYAYVMVSFRHAFSVSSASRPRYPVRCVLFVCMSLWSAGVRNKYLDICQCQARRAYDFGVKTPVGQMA